VAGGGGSKRAHGDGPRTISAAAWNNRRPTVSRFRGNHIPGPHLTQAQQRGGVRSPGRTTCCARDASGASRFSGPWGGHAQQRTASAQDTPANGTSAPREAGLANGRCRGL